MSETDIFKKIMQDYFKNPLGHKILIGNLEALIIAPDDRWMVMRDSPYRPGIGARIEEEFNLKPDIPQYGLRPIPRYVMKRIAKLADEGYHEEVSKILDGIISSKRPYGFEDIKRKRPHAIVDGPIVFTEKPIHEVIGRQLDLELKLKAELERMERRNIMYG